MAGFFVLSDNHWNRVDDTEQRKTPYPRNETGYGAKSQTINFDKKNVSDRVDQQTFVDFIDFLE